jgi:dynein heavy chain
LEANVKYSSLLIPNVDSTKASYILNILINPAKDFKVLISGDSGTAKTSNILLFTKYSPFSSQYLLKRINFSFATTPALLQEAIQEELEMKGSFLAPKKNEFHQLFFIDDLSMPELNKWGDQVTLELMRQTIEDTGFYIFKRGEEPKMGKINKTH